MTAVPHWDIVGPADTDADLARAAAAGDREAFAGIYDRYADRLHDFCVGMLRDRDDAADCVQDAFCTAAVRLGQLREADKLRPWLYAIARNEALRRLRDRRRETVSDELPETVSVEPGPETLAARTELADLISDAAGGLSDRDRSILELAYRHGLDGPDLAEALSVSSATANKMVFRLRDTVERALGALLVARRIRNTGAGCAELAAILDGWDGHFNVLMRKRIARHIESCPTCKDERQRLVSPVALLGAVPVFIPAPASLRERTLSGIQLAPSTTPIEVDGYAPDPASSDAVEDAPAPVPVVDDGGGRRTRRVLSIIGLLAVIGAASLGLTIAWQQQKNVNIDPADVKQTATQPISASPAPHRAKRRAIRYPSRPPRQRRRRLRRPRRLSLNLRRCRRPTKRRRRARWIRSHPWPTCPCRNDPFPSYLSHAGLPRTYRTTRCSRRTYDRSPRRESSVVRNHRQSSSRSGERSTRRLSHRPSEGRSTRFQTQTQDPPR